MNFRDFIPTAPSPLRTVLYMRAAAALAYLGDCGHEPAIGRVDIGQGHWTHWTDPPRIEIELPKGEGWPAGPLCHEICHPFFSSHTLAHLNDAWSEAVCETVRALLTALWAPGDGFVTYFRAGWHDPHGHWGRGQRLCRAAGVEFRGEPSWDLERFRAWWVGVVGRWSGEAEYFEAVAPCVPSAPQSTTPA